MNFKIKTLFLFLGAIVFFVCSLLVWAIFNLAEESKALKQIEKDRFLMFEKSDELRQSSDDLTRFARTYVITGNQRYKEIYFRILNIRNGIAKRPNNYSQIYWDISEPIRSQRHPLSAPISLKDELLKLPFLPYEIKKLEDSEFNSNQLVKLEIEAFNAMEGVFKDEKGEYTIQGDPNSIFARQLLHSPIYHQAKEKTMLPIDDFLNSLTGRTNQAINEKNRLILLAFKDIFYLLIFSFIAFISSVIIINKRVFSPIRYLTQVIASFKKQDAFEKNSPKFEDEIDHLTRSFFEMKQNMDEDLKRLDFALSAGHQGWFDIRLDTGKIFVSDEYAKILSYEPHQFSTNTKEWQNNLHPDDVDASNNAFRKCIATRSAVELEFRRKNKFGRWIWLHTIGEIVQWSEDDEPLRIIGIATDITENKLRQEKLDIIAHYDVLTKLPNRALFSDRFNQAIAHSNRTQTSLAICFLDLDDFKPVNDTYGHDVGDQLLIEVATRIKSNIRKEDTVSRLGGDEFAILLGDLKSLEQYQETIERIHQAIANPIVIEKIDHRVTASSGVTIYPSDRGDIDTLLRHADQAMYRAKLAGRNRFHLFNPQKDQQVIDKHRNIDEILQALENLQFQLYYQPKVNMLTGKVFGAEALIRWNHPDKGLVPPLDFLPFVQGSDLEIKIGDWVLAEAINQLEEWRSKGVHLEISVNISSHHLQSESFVKNLQKLLARYSKLDPNNLQLEILETGVLSNLRMISDIVKEIREDLGVNVALDDFGTGYSSLTHLRNLSANTIKIDRTFVRDILEDPDDYAIIDGVIGLADSFDRHIIAEGVETTEHGLLLILMGCENAQGFGIAKPMPKSKFEEWLNSYQINKTWKKQLGRNKSLKSKKLEIFKLTTSYWLEQFKKKILSNVDNNKQWPIIDKTKCPCGTWIIRMRKEQLIDQQWLAKLDKLHDEFHQIATELIEKYNLKKSGYTIKSIAPLKSKYQQIGELIKAHR